MKAFSSIDLYFLTKELKALEGSRIESFFYENQIFYIKTYLKREGNKFLTNGVSQYLYLGDSKIESSKPNSFISYLRKYLKNGIIQEVFQISGERILRLEISKKNPNENFKELGEKEFINYYLYLELFSGGNVILTNENNVLMSSLIQKSFKDRIVRAKQEYKFPPAKDLNVFDINLDKLKEKIENSELSLVKFLAIEFGLGGKIAQEVCFKGNFDKDLPIKETNLNSLLKELEILKNIESKGFVKKNSKEEVTDFFPFEFKSEENLLEVPSFNEALKLYFSQSVKNDDKKEKEFKKEFKKLENRLKKQEEQKEFILEESEKLNELGNKIYENFSLLEDFLNTINKVSKEKGWEHVQQVIKENPEKFKFVKKLNYKKNQVEVELN